MKMIYVLIVMVLLNSSAFSDIPSNFLTHKTQISFENFYEKRKANNGKYSEQRLYNSNLHFDSNFVENSDENQLLNSGVEIVNIDDMEDIKESSPKFIFNKENMKKPSKEIELIPSYKSHNLREYPLENSNLTIKHHIFEIFHHDKGFFNYCIFLKF